MQYGGCLPHGKAMIEAAGKAQNPTAQTPRKDQIPKLKAECQPDRFVRDLKLGH
jgi:hypothetical protein